MQTFIGCVSRANLLRPHFCITFVVSKSTTQKAKEREVEYKTSLSPSAVRQEGPSRSQGESMSIESERRSESVSPVPRRLLLTLARNVVCSSAYLVVGHFAEEINKQNSLSLHL